MKTMMTLLAAFVAGMISYGATVQREIREMTLDDCIGIAMQHNLDVQIKRFNPAIARYNLTGVYGSYDPLFSASGGHDYSQSPGGFDQQGRPFGGTETDDNRISSGFSGLLPWGMTYNLAVNLTDTYGTRPNTILGAVTGLSTNIAVFQQVGSPTLTTNFIIQPTYDVVQTRQPFENASGNAGFLQLRQPLLKNFWIDSTRLQIYMDKKALQSSEVDLRQQLITTVTATEEAYYNLIAAQKNVDVQSNALQLAHQLVVEDSKRAEVGTLTPLDVQQDKAQEASTLADLLNALGTEDTQQRVLKAQLSDDYSQWKDVSIKPSLKLVALPERFDLQASWLKGLNQRPDIQQQKISLEKQGYQVRYNKNQLFPQLDLVGGYGFNASAGSVWDAADQYRGLDNPFYSVGGQISIPLGNRSARNNYRAAKAVMEQTQAQLKQTQQAALILIENAIAVATTAFQRAEATREARVFAEAALDAEQKRLDSGKSTSYTVLQKQRDLTTARSNEIRALADYNNALAELASQEGATLERRHVTIEIK